jgi:hypothetical protein
VKAKVRITVVSEVSVEEANEAEFFKQIATFQKLALPGAKPLVLHIDGESFKWDDVKARISAVSTEVVAEQ